MNPSSLHDHYDRPDLAASIVASLRGMGVDLEAVTRDDLALVDEFHVRGREATRELAALAAPAPGTHVLDLGCGLGGPARLLADEFGCRVTGVDLVPAFVAAAARLSDLVGLADRTAFQAADMRALPFADASFDLVWTQHTLMNIPDKEAQAREMARVLKPGGRAALYEICAGDGRPIHLPVPWASAAEHSHLVAPDELLQAFSMAGLTIPSWEDVTAPALDWLDGVAAGPAPGAVAAPRPNLGLVMGPDAGLKSRNLGRNLREGRVVVVRALASR